jgi:L-iditol 2-dehydrogenase
VKALLLKEYRKLEIVEMPDPVPGPDEILVRIKACGICGSDIHGYDGRTGRRIPPLIMGHEASGIVEEAGPGVFQFRSGDRITFDSTVYCGTCFFCRRGEINLCDNRNVLGVSCAEYRKHGAFAELLALPQHIVYRLPDAVSFEQAAMIEALSIAVHAVQRASINLAVSVVVVGAGMIGQLVIQASRQAGCGQLMAIDLDDSRLQMAIRFGADLTIHADSPDLQAQILDATNGRGADIAFEVAGTDASFNTAVGCLRKGGTLTLIGNLSPKVEMPLQQIVTREIALIGSCASSGEYPACIELLARGKVDVLPLMTAYVALEEGPVWFERLYRREAGLMKIILKP